MTAPATRRGVTVVVPVYAHLDSVLECIDALLRHVAHPADRVLIMNDSGPEADELERAILPLIAEAPAFSYHRNPRNLGFVENCNRAVELDDTGNDILLLNSDAIMQEGVIDELAAVLHLSPWHAFVSPRSNNATIATIPFWRRDAGDLTLERSREVHAGVRELLPRYSIAPLSMGFCFLVRREIIDAHGLFDLAFSPGYGEENDLCLRMNALGHLSLIAHRAHVPHLGSASFTDRRNALREAHERLLLRRHPRYPAMVRAYLTEDVDPVDVFADLLVPRPGIVPRLLVDVTAAGHLPALTADLAALGERARRGELEAVVLRRPSQAPLDVPGLTDVTRIHPTLYDVAVIFGDRVSATHGARLNRVALSWVSVSSGESSTWTSRVASPRRSASRAALASSSAAIIARDDDTASLARSLATAAALDIDVVAATTADELWDAVLARSSSPVDPVALRRRWRMWTGTAHPHPGGGARAVAISMFRGVERRAPAFGTWTRRSLARARGWTRRQVPRSGP